MTKQLNNASDYAKSIANAVKYDAKNGESQQAYVSTTLRHMLGDMEIDDTVELTAGGLIEAAKEIKAAFPDDKALRNNAMSKFRMQLRRATEEITEEYTAGHKFATKKAAYDRILFTEKKTKEKETVVEALARVVAAYGLEDTASATMSIEGLADNVADLVLKASLRDAA